MIIAFFTGLGFGFGFGVAIWALIPHKKTFIIYLDSVQSKIKPSKEDKQYSNYIPFDINPN